MAMQQLTELRIMKNGDLKILLTDAGRDWFSEEYCPESMNSDNALWELLEQVICNSEYRLTDSSEVGGLTEAPMICEGCFYNDEGKLEYYPDWKLWYFADYMLICPVETLQQQGYVVFTKAD